MWASVKYSTVDLFGAVRQVSYDTQTQTIRVGGGCLWEQVYREAWKFGRGMVGGSTSEGVGEFTRVHRIIGLIFVLIVECRSQRVDGGSLKSNRYGLGIDNCRKIEVVLPHR
jgi:FAD/FMN-containing dehydrogenase